MRDSQVSEKERIEHIIQAIKEIETFTRACSKEAFLSDYVLISATLFQFAIIGEAVVHLDSNLLGKYNYPWHKVRGFRNFILHEYHSIEYRIIWETIRRDLPELKKMAELIRENEF